MTIFRILGSLSIILQVIFFVSCNGQTGHDKDISALVTAITNRDTTTIRQLVKQGVNMKPGFEMRLNYLIAIELEDDLGLELLLEKIDPNFSFNGESPYTLVIKKDNVYQAKVLMRVFSSDSPIHQESLLNFVRSREMFNLLRDKGVEPDEKTPFHLVDADLPVALRTMFAKQECSQFSVNKEGVNLIDYAKGKNANRILESIELFYGENQK